jgi:AbrB family looped-hinge helix DNA binding protein
MTTKVSSKGQVVLPAALRRQFALRPGEALEVTIDSQDGESRFILKRERSQKRKMKIVTDRVTGLPVLKGPPGTPKLTSEMVKEMLADFP